MTPALVYPRLSRLTRRWRIFFAVGLGTFVLDQLSKLWARTSLPASGEPVSVIENFFDVHLAHNKGMAFSLFEGGGAWSRVLLSVIALGALAGISYMVSKAREDNGRYVAGLALLAGGALGNLCDRIAMGEVTDFIRWRYYDRVWPTFNLADAFLLVGVVVLLWSSRQKRPETDTAAPP